MCSHPSSNWSNAIRKGNNMKKIAFIAIILSLISCTDEPRSREALRKSGFTDVKITGYSWFACADSDDFHTGFQAKNSQGEIVEGTVCCGIAKSCTIRF